MSVTTNCDSAAAYRDDIWLQCRKPDPGPRFVGYSSQVQGAQTSVESGQLTPEV